MKVLRAIIVGLMLSASVVFLAQDFDRGMAAYEAGDYTVALQEFLPLAELGAAQAQTIQHDADLLFG